MAIYIAPLPDSSIACAILLQATTVHFMNLLKIVNYSLYHFVTIAAYFMKACALISLSFRNIAWLICLDTDDRVGERKSDTQEFQLMDNLHFI